MTVEPSTSPAWIELFVNGTLMRGLELHGNLAGARFVGSAVTVPAYRLYAIARTYPAMQRDEAQGGAVAGELYELSLEHLGRVLDGEPDGLGIGVVELQDLGHRLGVLWVAGPLPPTAEEITQLGGWHAYRAQEPAA